MLPIGDDNSLVRKGSAQITWTIILVNVFAFIALQRFGNNYAAIASFATVPSEILSGSDVVTQARRMLDPDTGLSYILPGLGPTPLWVYFTLLTSMFMHGSFAHLAGNMLFMAIFGDNVECRIGKRRFIALYLGAGILGSLAQVGTVALTGGNPDSPMIGASGAISGILGAYLALFPGNRIYVLLFNFIPTAFSAWFVIGIWFVMQLFGGMAGMTAGGVAYAAHIGGFLVGWAWAKGYSRVEDDRLAREHIKRGSYGQSGDVRWWVVDDR
jgi:membrane associated rhomboid family serine protease